MKWVVVAIVLFVAGYTVVNVLYRKPGKAFRPYEDMNTRATTARLLSAGWQKTSIDLVRPTEKPSIGIAATIKRGPAGLGSDLGTAFAQKPQLLATVDRVTAADQVRRGETYRVHFSGKFGDQKLQVANAELLRRDHEIVLMPVAEKLPGNNLLSRWPDADFWTGIPTDNLPPGNYTMRILSHGPAAQWEFRVK